MRKNLIIISSDLTGHGHKSLTTALTEQLKSYPDVNFNVVDGFSLSGNIGVKIGKLYGVITRTSKDLWKLIWEISFKKPSLMTEITESSIRSRLLRLIYTMKPDAIVSTHPNYVRSILNVLEESKIDIPLYTVLADPVTISPLWADSRAYYTLCPTQESKEACLALGVPEEKLPVFGFPVRKRFTAHLDTVQAAEDYNSSRPLKCTIMSGGEGSGNMGRIAKILAKNFDCKIRIVCGRNQMLQRRLKRTLQGKYKHQIEILGFTDNIEKIMLDSDILFTRASPNTMLEAVMCNVPLIITGALPGQEQGNPAFAEKHNLGVVCNSLQDIKHIIQDLLANDAAKLNNIKLAQREYRNPNAARSIVDFILNH
jgi:processive 1,2-diacylglycerol beta-glucosyltransferase